MLYLPLYYSIKQRKDIMYRTGSIIPHILFITILSGVIIEQCMIAFMDQVITQSVPNISGKVICIRWMEKDFFIQHKASLLIRCQLSHSVTNLSLIHISEPTRQA